MKEDFGWISRTWRALRRIGEVARCGVRTTDQQVGCERRVLTLGARGGRRSTRANYLDVDHTPVQERLGWLWLSRQTASHFSQLDWSRAFRASFSEQKVTLGHKKRIKSHSSNALRSAKTDQLEQLNSELPLKMLPS